MTKTTIDLDTSLLEEAMKIFSGKTKREIISAALFEYVSRHKQKDLRDLFRDNRQYIADDYDYKALRGGDENGLG